jgi:hypothetical protein
MTRTIIIAAVGALGLLAATAAASAQTSPATKGPRTVATDVSAQSRPLRPRTRITVTRGYPYRTYSTTYPVPYPVEYPGPGFVRECSSRLVAENRVAGPVIVPKMRCWWQPGRSDLKSYP